MKDEEIPSAVTLGQEAASPLQGIERSVKLECKKMRKRLCKTGEDENSWSGIKSLVALVPTLVFLLSREF